MRPVIVMTQTSKFKQDDKHILHKPFIDVEPLSFDINLLDVDYDWLIFSSKNAVKYFQPFLSQVNVKNFAAIGAKTAEYCKSLGLDVLFYPSDYSQEGFLKCFQTEENSKILIPSSAYARPLLQRSLYQQGYQVCKIDLYRPVPHTKNIADVKRMMRNNELDVITFASSSAVKYFFEQSETPRFNHYYVIGQQTLDTVKQYGYDATTSNIQTLDSLINKVEESWENDAI